ncbi:ubiquitin-like FUBI-ribosomal protein eS30 fusion protein isoform X1 [Taeniopygia guttata]|uniref:ubiquitin-like FUBI-ribosomal protein eS30 fusion protein isoform X1 n=1 Tax=Taeniopygia guttata TaxID=59729 RepID=UPI003BB93383
MAAEAPEEGTGGTDGTGGALRAREWAGELRKPDDPLGLLGPLNFSGGDPNPSYNYWYQPPPCSSSSAARPSSPSSSPAPRPSPRSRRGWPSFRGSPPRSSCCCTPGPPWTMRPCWGRAPSPNSPPWTSPRACWAVRCTARSPAPAK